VNKFNTTQEVLKNLEAWKERNNKATLKASQILEKEDSERKQRELQELLRPVPPFVGDDATPQAKRLRLERSRKEYWYWDETYFPPSMYSDYSTPGQFHRTLCEIRTLQDKIAHVIHGPRAFGKTGTFKKGFVYDLLHGNRRFMLMGGETLTPAANSLRDIVMFLDTNDRIKNDYEIIWHQANEDTLFLQTSENPKGTYVSAISLERSSKGLQRNFFLRPDLAYLTDIESATSSLTFDSIALRIERINEIRTSLADNGTLIWEGNNFDLRCAMNHLVKEHERGILSPYFKLHIFPAWTNPATLNGIDSPSPSHQGEGWEGYGSLWPERYPASTEAELRAQCKPKDEYDWLGNFQGTPRIKSGDIFSDTYYQEWIELPNDLKGVIYTDPNCSLKGQGNTTACTALAWSPSTMCYYIFGILCKSYSDSDKLLMDVLTLRSLNTDHVSGLHLALDGNVTQESTWTNHIRNFVRIHKFPFPIIHYKRYKVDDITKGAQTAYQTGKIFFPPNFRTLPEGKSYTDQLFAFRGKKANKEDDAPDSLISAFEFLHEVFHPSVSGTDGDDIHILSTRTLTGKL